MEEYRYNSHKLQKINHKTDQGNSYNYIKCYYENLNKIIVLEYYGINHFWK